VWAKALTERAPQPRAALAQRSAWTHSTIGSANADESLYQDDRTERLFPLEE
jgi:hypothetical protein